MVEIGCITLEPDFAFLHTHSLIKNTLMEIKQKEEGEEVQDVGHALVDEGTRHAVMGTGGADAPMKEGLKEGDGIKNDSVSKGDEMLAQIRSGVKPPAESPVLLPIMRNALSEFSPTGTSLLSKSGGGDAYAQTYFTEAQAIIAAQIAARAAADVGLCYPWNFTQGQMMPPQAGVISEADRRRSSSVAESDTADAITPGDGGLQVSMAANDDGYNWRKYGEKNVKGSKYPRSYYKCSTPGCTMKKVVERDPVSGIISNTLLKGGEHNHPRPNAARVDVSAFVQSATQAPRYTHDDTPSKPTQKRKRVSIQSSGDGSERLDATRVMEPEDSKRHGEQSQDHTDPTTSITDKVHSKEDMKESAVMALQLLGTGFSPDIPSLGPGMSGTPTNLLPLPATLRSSPLIAKTKNGTKSHTLYTVYSSPNHQAPSDLLDHGEVNSEDEWEMAEEDFGTEDNETVNAAIAAAAAYICRELKNPSIDDTKMKREDTMMIAAEADEKKAMPKKSASKAPREKKTERKKHETSKTVIRTETDSDQIEDGYKWRKYGQKVVKGNPHPRSYYKCTSTGCRVRKQVERCSDNVGVLITTYEGKHTHDPPLMRNNNTQSRVKMPGDQGYIADKNQVFSPALAPACFPMMSPASLMASDSPNTFGHHFLSGSPSIHQDTPDHVPHSLGISSPAEQLQLYSIQQAAAQQKINAHLVQQAKAWQEALARSPAALQTFQMLAQQQQQSPRGGSLDVTQSPNKNQ
ncbi:WRKY transcription factor WRKY24 [Picochlorum sp. SENEW3]|nr:WRKY transcription factor WRKY24 [Picochlorum sp. SENEW3]